MGNGPACCSPNADEHTNLPPDSGTDETSFAADSPIHLQGGSAPHTFHVYLEKSKGKKLGIDVDFVRERTVLPITAVTGGVAETWNKLHPGSQLRKGDSIVEVNGTRKDVSAMMAKCKNEAFLELTVKRALNLKELVRELEQLVMMGCGPIFVRLSWQDAGVFSTGEYAGGCPNAALRFTDGGEGMFAANAGLSTVALGLLAPISERFCPDLLSHADLWALAANVAIRVMGGPDIPTHFGREDALSSAESVEAEWERLPDGAGDAAHLRRIFHPKGFSDKQIVALSGAHTLGRCHLDRSGYDGPWTKDPLRFDNSYFKALVENAYVAETTQEGCLQHRCEEGTIMLPSDLALLQNPGFRKFVEGYAADEQAFFADFADCWLRLQELGCAKLRDVL